MSSALVFNANRVANVENAILKVHFAFRSFDETSGRLWLPLAVSIAVILLSLFCW